MTDSPATGAIPDSDLVDEEQVGLLLEVLTAEDWTASVDAFAGHGRETVDALIAQARAGEPHGRTAHSLKGTALNLGAAALTRLAKELEHADADAVLARADDLSALFERSLVQLRSRRPAA